MERPHYKTWIRRRPLIIFAVLTAASLALSLLALRSLLFLAFLVPAAVFGYILLIVGLSWWQFTPRGGNYQVRVHDLLVARMTHAERVLDIGCGSGHLLSRIAKANPAAALTGLDYWGDNWEYSQGLCEANFRAEGLSGRAQFVRGSASSLPADLGEFDGVVSCMTFHEVRDTTDKTQSLREAMAHVAPGGRFAFIDLFGDPSFYPDQQAIARAIEESGGRIRERTPLEQLLPLPFPLKHRRVLGHAELIAGERPVP